MANPLSDFHSQSASGAPQPAGGEPAPESDNPYQSPVPEAPEIQQQPAPKFSPLEAQIAVLMQQGKNGAKWFSWIAGLSVVNSLLMIFGAQITLVFGLGTTFIGGALAEGAAQNSPENAVIARAIGFGFTLFLASIFYGFGWLANQRFQSMYFLGMVLYLLDGLLFVPFQMWIGAASHAYALYIMWGGFQAYRKLAVLERQLMDPMHPAGGFNPHQ